MKERKNIITSEGTLVQKCFTITDLLPLQILSRAVFVMGLLNTITNSQESVQ